MTRYRPVIGALLAAVAMATCAAVAKPARAQTTVPMQPYTMEGVCVPMAAVPDLTGIASPVVEHVMEDADGDAWVIVRDRAEKSDTFMGFVKADHGVFCVVARAPAEKRA